MHPKDLLKRFDQERQTLAPPHARFEKTESLVRILYQEIPFALIEYSRLSPGQVTQTALQEIAYFQRRGLDFEWKTYTHDQPPDLAKRLEELGFSVGALESVLVAETSQVACQKAPEHEIRRLERQEELEDYLSVQRQIWPDGDFGSLEDLRSQLSQGKECASLYVAYQQGKPVGCARATFHAQSLFSGLWGGSVLPEARRQGVYRSLVARRAQDAQKLGARYLRVDALPTSQPILEQLGFWKLTATQPCLWQQTKDA